MWIFFGKIISVGVRLFGTSEYVVEFTLLIQVSNYIEVDLEVVVASLARGQF